MEYQFNMHGQTVTVHNDMGEALIIIDDSELNSGSYAISLTKEQWEKIGEVMKFDWKTPRYVYSQFNESEWEIITVFDSLEELKEYMEWVGESVEFKAFPTVWGANKIEKV